MNNVEITKVKRDKTTLGKKLDEFSTKGVTIDRIDEFNELCRQEVILTMKERLLTRKPGDPIIPPRITRKITLIPLVTQPPKK